MPTETYTEPSTQIDATDAIGAAMPDVNGNFWSPMTTTRIATPVVQGAQTAAHGSQARRLTELACHAELFHAPMGRPYATIHVKGHKETWPIGSRQFRSWLQREFLRSAGQPASTQAVQDAVALLGGQAEHEAPECAVFTRIAQHGPKLYLDLANDDWQAVEVDVTGWRLVDVPPVKFRRTQVMSALPRPEPGSGLEDLRGFVNVATDHDWRLLLTWLFASLRPQGPHPILALHGEQGSSKSTTARVLKALVDPSRIPLRAEPHNEQDLVLGATNAWLLALDNVSHLPVWLSDALCRIASGGGFATRALYSQEEEAVYDVRGPVILNGIEDLATRADLLDRVLLLELPVIPDARRRTEEEFWGAFNAALPQMLGAVLDAMSTTLAAVQSVRLASSPRMADFARLGAAAERGLGWPTGSFEQAYTGNRQSGNSVALEASPLGLAVIDLIDEVGEWRGTAAELLNGLNDRAGAYVVRQRSWPKSAAKLAGGLRRLAPSLRSTGVKIEFGQESGNGSRKLISIRRATPAISSARVASVACVASKESDNPAGILASGSNKNWDTPGWTLERRRDPVRLGR